MGTQWTNKYAILRDLSFAQGRKVPAELVGSIGIGEKPPTINIEEETEEEFFKNNVGDGELHTKPDLDLIKQLLDEVREIEVDHLNNGDTEKVLEISKLNPLSEEFVPNNPEAGDTITESICVKDKIQSTTEKKAEDVGESPKIKPKKKRRERNFALITLLEKEHLENCSVAENCNNITTPLSIPAPENHDVTIDNLVVKLLKPNDFIVDTTVTKSVEKVNEWLHTPAKCPSPKAEPIAFPASTMFKRKKPLTPVLETTSMFKRKSDTSSNKSVDSDTVEGQANDTFVQSPHPRESSNTFVPSAYANEYYKKFVERSKVQELVTEDLWERAQREMKEIDAKRLRARQDRLAWSQLRVNTQQEANANPEATSRNETAPSLLADVRGE